MAFFALKVATIVSPDSELALQAEMLVPITFLVIVGTVAIYGLLAAPLAKYLVNVAFVQEWPSAHTALEPSFF